MSAGSLFGRGLGLTWRNAPRILQQPVVRRKGSEFADEFFTEMYYDLHGEQMGIPTQTGKPTIGGIAYQCVKNLMIRPRMSGSVKSVLLPRSHGEDQQQERFKHAVGQVIPGDAVVISHLRNDPVFMEAFKLHRSPGGGTLTQSAYIEGKLEMMNIQTPEEMDRE